MVADVLLRNIFVIFEVYASYKQRVRSAISSSRRPLFQCWHLIKNINKIGLLNKLTNINEFKDLQVNQLAPNAPLIITEGSVK